MEAFSDGVMAILITIMVLDLKVPQGDRIEDLFTLWPVFLSYVLSFALLGIYWNNHHHLLQAVEVVDGRVLLANLHLLFWLSLFPFATSWMGEHDFAAVPTAGYGVVMVAAAVAFYILVRALIAANGTDSKLAAAIGNDMKGKISPVLFGVAVPVSLLVPFAGLAIYILVALIWVVPDRRIERVLAS
jgi:uncharacterized membrane protein